jgi:hypothetical protein
MTVDYMPLKKADAQNDPKLTSALRHLDGAESDIDIAFGFDSLERAVETGARTDNILTVMHEQGQNIGLSRILGNCVDIVDKLGESRGYSRPDKFKLETVKLFEKAGRKGEALETLKEIIQIFDVYNMRADGKKNLDYLAGQLEDEFSDLSKDDRVFAEEQVTYRLMQLALLKHAAKDRDSIKFVKNPFISVPESRLTEKLETMKEKYVAFLADTSVEEAKGMSLEELQEYVGDKTIAYIQKMREDTLGPIYIGNIINITDSVLIRSEINMDGPGIYTLNGSVVSRSEISGSEGEAVDLVELHQKTPDYGFLPKITLESVTAEHSRKVTEDWQNTVAGMMEDMPTAEELRQADADLRKRKTEAFNALAALPKETLTKKKPGFLSRLFGRGK